MAALTNANAQALYSQGGPDLVALFALRFVQTGDTLDIATLDIAPVFQLVRKAILFSVALNAAVIAPVAGTVVTIPANVPAGSSGYLLVGGC